MVIFQSPGGSPGYNQFESLDEAVAFVEQLRNERHVSSARMFALEEIKFELRPYYRVELQALNSGQPASPEALADSAGEQAAPPAHAPAPAPAPSPSPVEAPPVPEASTFGAFTAAPPADSPGPAPPPPPPEPPPAESEPEHAPSRRGLFGR